MITVLLTSNERQILSYILNYELYMSVGAILDDHGAVRNDKMIRIVRQTDAIFQLRTLLSVAKDGEDDKVYFTDLGFSYLQTLVSNSGKIPIPPSIGGLYSGVKDSLMFKFQNFDTPEVSPFGEN